MGGCDDNFLLCISFIIFMVLVGYVNNLYTMLKRQIVSESFHLVTVTVASSLVTQWYCLVFFYKENQGSTINR